MGVLGAPLGQFWECLRVPWGHLGPACGALAVLKIIEKQCVFIAFPAMGDPWATLERPWFVLWGCWVLFGGHWALLGVILGLHGIIMDLFGSGWGSLGHDGPLWGHPGGPLATGRAPAQGLR